MIKGLKKVISSIAALALTTTSVAIPALAKEFSDVASTATYYQAVQELSNLGIINGYEDGTFQPDNTVTRAEFAVMVCGALGQTDSAAALTTSAPFDDVPSGHWAAGYVSVAVNAGIISGYGDGTFGPDDEVTYEQIMKMLVCALNQQQNAEYSGGYPSGYISVASQVGINDGLSIADSTAAATRKDVAVMVDNALRSYDYQKPNGYILGIAQYTDDDYDTLLSENHDTYIVQGRVTATRDSDPSSLSTGEVRFKIEYSKNFDGYVYERSSGYSETIMYSGDSGAENYLDSYGEALIQVTDDDDYVIISFVPSGKNTEVEFACDDFADDYKSYNSLEGEDLAQYIVDSKKIYVYKEGSTSSVNTYTLASDNDITLYVNGVNMGTSADSTFVDYLNTYFVQNNVGEVTLVDTPQSGSTSADGKYDIIRVTYAQVGRVTSTSIRNDIARIYVSGSEIDKSRVEIDMTDEDVTWSVTIDGEEATLEDIAVDDVIAVYMDPVNDSFFNIVVTRGTVTGTITRTRTLSDGTLAYTVDGTEYTALSTVSIDATSGAEYELWIDCFNRIVDAEEGSTTNTYAIIQNVYESSDGETVNVTLIKTDGTSKTYALNTSKVTEAEARALCFANGTSGTKLAIDERVVTYKLNSSSEIRSLEAASDTKYASGEYSASAAKVGSVRISDATAILDVTEAIDDPSGYSVSDITSVSSLSDGTEYSVLGVGRSSNSTTYQFVLVLSGESDYTADTVVAVFDSYGSGYYNDESVFYISAYIDGSDELETLYVEDGTDEVYDFERGMAFVYKVNSDGIIEDGDLHILAYDSLFKNLNITSGLSVKSTLKYLVAATADCEYGDDDADNYNMFVLSGLAAYDKDFSNSDDEVRFIFAPVVDVSTTSLTLGRVRYDSSNDVYYSTEDDQIVYTTSGANAYVYDYSYSKDYRLDVYSVSGLPSVNFTAQAQISKNNSPSGGIWVGGVQSSFGLDEDGNYDDDYVNTIIWNADDQLDNTNYVFAKVVDDDITDVIYFAVD